MCALLTGTSALSLGEGRVSAMLQLFRSCSLAVGGWGGGGAWVYYLAWHGALDVSHALSGHYSREWSECTRVNGVNE